MISEIVIDDPSVSLVTVLNLIPGDQYVWSVQFLEARGRLSGGVSMLELEGRAKADPAGVLMNWSELVGFAGDCDEIIDLLLVASEDAKAICRFPEDQDAYAHFAMVVEMIDSSHWMIHATQTDLVGKLGEAFGSSRRKP